MKKSLLLALALPLLLGGCTGSVNNQNTFQTTPQPSTPTGGTTGQQSGTQTDQGTGGSGTGTTTGEGTQTGGGTSGEGTGTGSQTGGGTSGGGTGTGGQSTGGGGSQTGGGTSGGGSESGGQTQTSKTVSKAMADLGIANQKDVTSFNLASDLQVTCAQGSNKQNKPKYYTSDQALRLYGGNTITFESTSNITKIQFVQSSETNNEELEASTGSFKNDCWTGNAKSVTLTVFGGSGKYCIVSISATYSGSGTTTGGGTETGGGGSGTGGGGSQTSGTDDGANYLSTWPENFQPFVTTYLNGMLPCYLNTNKKNLFTGYMTGTCTLYDDNDHPYLVPYFNPYIKNTSPGINYEYNYGTILRNAGFKQTDEIYDDELEAKVYYYQKGQCCVQYNKHRSDEDGLYYFDVYAYYDNYYTGSFKNSYNIQYDNKELALQNRYESNNKTVKVGNWDITMSNVMKSSYSIQLKADSGSIAIKGSLKGLIIEPSLGTNVEALFVKAGTSASNAKYIFNNGGYFEFPTGTTYAEISAKYRVLNIEFFDIIY